MKRETLRGAEKDELTFCAKQIKRWPRLNPIRLVAIKVPSDTPEELSFVSCEMGPARKISYEALPGQDTLVRCVVLGGNLLLVVLKGNQKETSKKTQYEGPSKSPASARVKTR